MMRERLQPDRIPFPWRRLATSMALAAFVTTACSGPSAISSLAPGRSSEPSIGGGGSLTVASSAVAESAGAGSATVTPLLFGCSRDAPCKLEAGTYETSGQWAFLRGLRVTLPAGWFSDEQDAGEFNLHPVEEPDSGVVFWKDLSATANDPAGTPVAGVSGTAASLVSWLRSNPDLIVTEPRPTMIGRLAAVTVDIQVSSKAKSVGSDCPVKPCVGFMRDVNHWDGPYSLFRGEILRTAFATIGPSSDLHTFVVGIHAPGFPPYGDKLDAITERVGPILDSVVVPDVIVEN